MKKIKHSTNDFTVINMPHNRREVFFDVIGLHWKKFLLYGLLILLVTFPLHLFAIVEDLQIAELMKGFDKISAEERAEVRLQIVSLKNAHAVINIPFIILISVFLAGFLRVIRQYAWLENVFFSWEFSQGFKQNFKQSVAICTIFSVVIAIANTSVNMSTLSDDTTVGLIMYLPLGFVLFVMIPILAYSCVCISVYDNTLKDNLYAGFALTAKAPFKTILAAACCISPYLLSFIPNMALHAVLALTGSLLAPFISLAWYLFASDQMDIHFNSKSFPELVGKGTYKQE